MGKLTILADVLLFPFFLTIVICGPLLDSQAILPARLYPKALFDIDQYYVNNGDDYLIKEKPSFFLGLIWVELIVQWPVCLMNVIGILGRKRWLPTTCLMYGVCAITGMTAIIAEMLGSQKASNTMWKVYLPFFGSGVLAILRGLLTQSSSRHQVSTKKRD